MNRCLLSLLFIVSGCIASLGQTDDAIFNQAQQAYLNRDYKEAFLLYKQSADAGNPEAMHNVAVMLIQPLGCVQDVAAAIDYYIKASKAGYNPSTYNLGHMNYMGNLNGEVNKPMAANFFRMAADNGHPESAHYLGLMYKDGDGVEQDTEKAIKYMRIAATEGDIPISKAVLGMMLTDWARSEAEIREGVDFLLKARTRMTSPEIDFAIALEYDHGGHMPLDVINAIQYYKKAADNGNVYAMRRYGVLNISESASQCNPVIGVRYIKRAADNGDLPSKAVYAYLLHVGKFMPKNKSLALKYYQEAYDAGYKQNTWYNLMALLCDNSVDGYNPEKGVAVVKEMAPSDEKANQLYNSTLDEVAEGMSEFKEYIEQMKIPLDVRKNRPQLKTTTL
ncbi:MAG: sel1 repeat family protein [Muribaculaceae bacterium]|nr:sel1 repeat family protein [Muribaculaceae bacterium]